MYISLYYFINNSEIINNITQLDNACLVVAGLCHDVAHPGLTNRYLVQSRDKIAIQYNDISVLESMHCSLIFSLMVPGFCDIFAELTDDE